MLFPSRKLALFFVVIAAICAAKTWAQYPDTLWVPVTFYDFHSNGTNPEFEMSHVGGQRSGQVAITLDADKKPFLGATPYLNYGIKYWFRKWDPIAAPIHAKGDSMKPGYDGAGVFQGFTNVHQDTFFKNIVIKDSLPFIHQGGGTYLFERDGQNNTPQFFWIDGKGFGNEGLSHNYAFTMELHRTFAYKRGMQFQFNGDDDVWAYVDGRLAMDLGGVHSSLGNTFTIDNMGLIEGREYDFDFFYAERHTNEANIKILTNIVTATPGLVDIKAAPDSVVQAGSTVTLSGKVYDQKGVLQPQFADSIRWDYVDPVNNPPSSFNTMRGGTVLFTPTEAYTTVLVIATIYDSYNGLNVRDTIRIYVVPGPATHLVIEERADSMASLRNDRPIDLVTFTSGMTADSVYAMMRDRYGNFVRHGNPATWSSLDAAVVTIPVAGGGRAIQGEGVITRVALLNDTTFITATSGGFKDSVMVRTSSIYYTAIRITAKNGVTNTLLDTLVMSVDNDTSLYAQGLRSDKNVWDSVEVHWATQGLSTTTTPPASASKWLDIAATAVTPVSGGQLIIDKLKPDGSYARDTITVILTTGIARTVDIYSKVGKPSATIVPYGEPTTAIVCTAGVALPLVGKAFDKLNNWLTEYESVDSLSRLISWKLSDPSVGSLSATTGFQSSFTSTTAYMSTYIIATFRSRDGLITDYDSIRVTIEPNIPTRLYLENSKLKAASPNAPAGLDSIQISSDQISRSVFAILRDQYGNYVRCSDSTTFTSANLSVATVVGGLPQDGEGIVYRNPLLTTQGSTTIIGKDLDYGGVAFSDTIKVNILQYYYTRLRIVVRDSTRIDSLIMYTDADTTIKVQGLRSDDVTKWEFVDATWQKQQSPAFAITGLVPDKASQWRFSPAAPGTGWIRVTLNDDAATIPDTIGARFIRSDPSIIDMQILTPPSQRIAGKPISVIVSVSNKDGLVPGAYCLPTGSVKFQENNGTGGRSEGPQVVVNGTDTTTINKRPATSVTTNECFSGGLDTVEILLYYVPNSKDSLNRIYITSGTLTDSTDRFALLPGALDSIALETNSGQHITQTTLNYPGGYISLYAIGYDAWKNKLPNPIPGEWTQNSTLHPVNAGYGAVRVFINSAEVLGDERGYVFVQALDTSNGRIRDSALITIIGPLPALLSAITRDTSGNGYLDGIELHFDKTITIPAGFAFTDDDTLSISDGSTVYRVASITTRSGVALTANSALRDSVFIVHLIENTTGGFQTASRPTLTINGLYGTEPIGILSTDGAGPVITSVTRTLGNGTDNIKDVITVTYSEPVAGDDNSALKLSNKPELMFNVWKRTSGGYELVDSVFSGITTLTSVGQTSVVFYMANGKELSTDYYLSIAVDTALSVDSLIAKTNEQITDQSADRNLPNENNRRVGIIITNGDVDNLKASPSPFKPTTAHPTDNLLMGGPNYPVDTERKKFRQNVVNEGRGTVLTIPIAASSDLNDSISAVLLIFDVVGNLVAQSQSAPDIRTQQMKDNAGKAYEYDVYWNGTNDKGMACAPGIYRVIMLIKSKTVSKGKKVATTVGVQ